MNDCKWEERFSKTLKARYSICKTCGKVEHKRADDLSMMPCTEFNPKFNPEKSKDLPLKRIKVYTASKVFRANFWLSLEEKWPEIDFVARWRKFEPNVPQKPEFARVFWQYDIEDVKKADLLLLLADPEDKLAGTIIEAGAALGADKPVILLGENEIFSTWQWHPLVFRPGSLDEARLLIKLMKSDLLAKRNK